MSDIKEELIDILIGYSLDTYEDIQYVADELISKGVVPVVRCRECMHWKPTGSKAGNSSSDMEYIGGCEFTNYCRR